MSSYLGVDPGRSKTGLALVAADGKILSLHIAMTDNLAAEADKRKAFGLCITPEGTRSLNPEWKKGFYFIALKAHLPIHLYGLDYEKKVIQCTRQIIPSGDVDKDMREIKLYFKDFKGKKPEKFTIGNID